MYNPLSVKELSAVPAIHPEGRGYSEDVPAFSVDGKHGEAMVAQQLA